MFSILSFFSKDDQFIGLLEKSARQAHEMALALQSLVNGDTGEHTVFNKAEYDDKKLTESIRELLVTTFVTALEREDIESLSNSLFKISKTINKFAERYQAARHLTGPERFTEQLQYLCDSTAILVQMVACLRKISDIKQAKVLKDRLDQCEYQADKLLAKGIADLYQNEPDAIRLFANKDLLAHLESAIDRCRNSGDLVYHIVLKNS